jgi:DNA-binding transcriptional LysR family regulator
LEIFCAVAEAGSFTAAATRVHLTQSAVSQQVAALERDLGLALVERIARGVRLTAAGAALAGRARLLLQDLSRLEKDLQRLIDPPRIVRLGVFATAGAHLVPMLVQAYRQRHPDTRLVLNPTLREDLAAKLADNEIDVGVTWDYDFLIQPIAGVQRLHLFDDPLCLLVPIDHPLARVRGPVRLIEAAGEPWIVRTHRSGFYADAFEAMCRIAGFEPCVVFRTEDYPSTQGFVAANVGLAIAPQLSVRAQRPDIVVRPIEDPGFARQIDAVTLVGAGDDPLISQLLNLLRELKTMGATSYATPHKRQTARKAPVGCA